MNMIPNPRKSFTIQFSMDEVKKAVEGIPAFTTQKYQMHATNDVFNQYTLSAFELLSLGVYIDVVLSASGEGATALDIEVRRKTGAFDQWHEVQRANEHLAKLTEAITLLIKHHRDPEANPLPSQEVPDINSPWANVLVFFVLASIIGAALVFIFK